MLLVSLLVALFICQPCFVLGRSHSSQVSKKIKKYTPRIKPPINYTEAVQFLTALNGAFQENGLSVLSQEEIQNLPQKISYCSSRKPLSVLRGCFAALMKTMITKNPNVDSKKYRISLSTLPPFQEFLVQYTVPLAQKVQEKINTGTKIDFNQVEAGLYEIIREKVSSGSITSTFQAIFPKEKVDFTEIRQLSQRHELITPQFSWSPSGFVYALINCNKNQEGIRRIRNLPIKGSLFTRWIILSLKEVVGCGYPFKHFSEKSVQYDTLHTLFSLVYANESS